MKKRNILVILIAIVVIFGFVILEMNRIISNISSPSKIFYCSRDTDCVFVCGSCENVTYFDSNPPSQCATATQTGTRSCFCVNNQCSIVTNATTQSSFIQSNGSEGFNNYYIFIGIIVVVAFIVLAVFVNYMMKSPTEMWLL